MKAGPSSRLFSRARVGGTRKEAFFLSQYDVLFFQPAQSSPGAEGRWGYFTLCSLGKQVYLLMGCGWDGVGGFANLTKLHTQHRP